MVTTKRIGVLAGGTSAERDVSLRSGTAVFNALKNLGYNVVFIDASEMLCEVLKTEKIEAAFIVLHGGAGENGAVQGLLETMGIPYTGAGVLASALAMDKEASKKAFLYHGLPVAPFIVINHSQVSSHGLQAGKSVLAGVSISFNMPWVIKPATEGSSVGVTIVRHRDQIDKALGKAFAYGERVIIEKYIKGKEIQIGILGRKALGGVEVRPSREFYDYEAKYIKGLTEYILPPSIDEIAYEKCKEVALGAHNALGCSGATRVDLILDEQGMPFVLEVNTIPGMTETSLLPKIAGLANMNFAGLVEEMLRQSLAGE